MDEAGLVCRANCSDLITKQLDHATMAYNALASVVRNAEIMLLMQVSVQRTAAGGPCGSLMSVVWV